jgi:hypothetical protein
MPTSARNQGCPLPSMTCPPAISMSNMAMPARFQEMAILIEWLDKSK